MTDLISTIRESLSNASKTVRTAVASLAMSAGILAALCLVVTVSGCGGGTGSDSGGSVNQIPGGGVPAGTPALLVGDKSDTNAIQLSQTMANNGYKVDFAPSVPSNTNSYTVVVIDESAQISSGSAATVKSLLDQGKGVVLLGRTPAILATGSKTLPADTTSISSWFGGITQMQSGRYFGLHVTKNALVTIPDILAYGQRVYDSTPTDDSNGVPYVPSDKIGPNAAPTLQSYSDSFGFAYTPASGGRVYWQWSPFGTNSNYFTDMTAVFAAGTRWAAGFQK